MSGLLQSGFLLQNIICYICLQVDPLSSWRWFLLVRFQFDQEFTELIADSKALSDNCIFIKEN